jgi:hypothetical protein
MSEYNKLSRTGGRPGVLAFVGTPGESANGSVRASDRRARGVWSSTPRMIAPFRFLKCQGVLSRPRRHGCPHAGALSTNHEERPRSPTVFGWLGPMKLLHRITRRAKGIRTAVDAGMTTAEYAVGTIAAVAFAAVLSPRCPRWSRPPCGCPAELSWHGARWHGARWHGARRHGA